MTAAKAREGASRKRQMTAKRFMTSRLIEGRAAKNNILIFYRVAAPLGCVVRDIVAFFSSLYIIIRSKAENQIQRCRVCQRSPALEVSDEMPLLCVLPARRFHGITVIALGVKAAGKRSDARNTPLPQAYRHPGARSARQAPLSQELNDAVLPHDRGP